MGFLRPVHFFFVESVFCGGLRLESTIETVDYSVIIKKRTYAASAPAAVTGAAAATAAPRGAVSTGHGMGQRGRAQDVGCTALHTQTEPFIVTYGSRGSLSVLAQCAVLQ